MSKRTSRHVSLTTKPDDSDEALSWRRAIEKVLTGTGLRLASQPIVDIVHARVVGYELLARFSGPPEASPDVWFRWAEKFGMGAALDVRVVTIALSMRQLLPPDTFLTINIDPHHLSDAGLIDTFAAAGNLERIVIELTEHRVIDDYDATVKLLSPLRAAGAKIAIDDAGSGYAGLQWLLALSPDLVKIDRALIDHVDEDEIKTALVEMLGAMADRIDAWVLAEGVERASELDVLMRMGVPLVQGYLLARPSFEVWPTIDFDALSSLALRSVGESTEPTLAPLVETVNKRRENAGVVPGICVVVDEFDQPLLLDSPECQGAKVLTLRPSETVRSAIERAMLRAPVERWQPIVCVNEVRQTLGIVRMERLIQSLISEVDRENSRLEET
jgi:EAL domain-containing protein (putative c-di-GMP-specific phosphodiesterase class I)